MNWPQRFILTILLVSFHTYAKDINTTAPISGRNPVNTQEMIPADVLSRVALLQKEISLVREAMGKPKQAQVVISVSNASPREVYQLATALYKKADRLAFEVTGSSNIKKELDEPKIAPAHVWGLVNDSLKRVLLVKKALGIHQEVKEVLSPQATQPTDVFNAILQANQQLNVLLEKRFSPSDVFEQVTVAVIYAEQILNHLGVKDRIPKEPAIKDNKRPQDVFKKLLVCLEIIEKIAQREKLNMLEVTVNTENTHQVIPSNVYDLTMIIVSELKYISKKNKTFRKVDPYYVGYKTPTLVFQRVGILLQQLKLIEKHMLSGEAKKPAQDAADLSQQDGTDVR